MTEDVKQQSNIDFWRMIQIVSPLVAMISFVVYMKADIGSTVRDVEILKRYNDNISEVLTAHTTQIAVNSNDIQTNKRNDMKLEATLIRLETKIDELLKEQRNK